MQKGLL